MKAIKWLWSLSFAFAIVLFYAAASSMFLTPFSDWYLALEMPEGMLSGSSMSLFWAINYILSIVVLTRLIFSHKNVRAIVAMALIGVLQIVWTAVFFSFHSLLGGVIVEIILLLTSAVALGCFKEDITSVALFFLISIWYAYLALQGFIVLLVN